MILKRRNIISALRRIEATYEGRHNMGRITNMLEKRKVNSERLEREAPNLFKGFNELVMQYYKPGAIDRKHKELMAIVGSVITRCISCLANHANEAIAAGATRDEVFEAAAIGIDYGGGASFVMVRDNLLDILDEIGKAKS
jgi:AhpD family alkylhydroperoxidase